jgi:hypothetical protein
MLFSVGLKSTKKCLKIESAIGFGQSYAFCENDFFEYVSCHFHVTILFGCTVECLLTDYVLN